MVYSSVLGLAWIFTSKTLGRAIIFLISYSLRFFYISKIAKITNLVNLNNKAYENERLIRILVIFIWILNIAGIPPLVGFYAKLNLLIQLREFKVYLVIFFLLLASGIFVYTYLQIRFYELCFLKTTNVRNKTINEEFVNVVGLLLVRLIFLVILCGIREFDSLNNKEIYFT